MLKDPKAFLALLIITLIVVIKTIRLTTLQQVKQNLRKLPKSFKYCADFKLRAPKDRLYVLNFILITFAGIFLIHIEEESGIIKGDPDSSKWTATKRFRTIEFDNPVSFTQKLIPLVSNIADNLKENIPIYPVVVFNNRTNIKNVTSSDTPVIKANELTDYINSFNETKLEQPDINLMLDELKRYRFDF
ncbi:MAG: NERD domain-containing protein [Clostridia bacterium]